ncbi:MAG: response regulator [Chloroflexaceae bacterium]|nr:response regulator [Chloroflexaceae bacterium]
MKALNRILLVEDEPDIQSIARLALEAIGGFTVEVCGSGREALDLAPSFAPDLFILDVMMPEMTGPDTLKALRSMETTAQTPIIFMTAKVQPHEITAYKQLGALDVIMKPFDAMTLSATITTIWSQYYGQTG